MLWHAYKIILKIERTELQAPTNNAHRTFLDYKTIRSIVHPTEGLASGSSTAAAAVPAAAAAAASKTAVV